MRTTKIILVLVWLVYSCSTHKELRFSVLADKPGIVDQIEKTRQQLSHYQLIDSIKIYGINNYKPILDIQVNQERIEHFKIPKSEISLFVDNLLPIEKINDVQGITVRSSTGENIPVSAFINFVSKSKIVSPEVYIPDTTTPYIIYNEEISLIVYCRKMNAQTVHDTLQYYLKKAK
ncbi:MAG: hypothetical protein MI922_10260 [Bacteroidales bacterium]|nr:hypothetical protein [Bacteroidales bacterium]